MTHSLQTGAILMGLFGGLAIFLYGMELMTRALKASSGRRLKSLLTRMTTNHVKGVLAGAIITAIIQSSSVTTVLVVGFVAAGLMKLEQTIPIIMGASIGTTVTAQIIAFDITHYALLIVATGFAVHFLARNELLQRTGTMVFGFGLIFFGMSLMGDATAPLRDYPPFIELLREMDHPLYGILLSALFTAVIQSSSATTGVIIMLGSEGLISLEQGIALVFGANIGTCVTALLAAIGNSRDALRTALVHISFNTIGVVLWYPFIDQFAELVRYISPQAPELRGTLRLAAEAPRQIANAHTLFNVGNTLLFLGFTRQFARLVTWMVPVTEAEKAAKVAPRYLDPNLLDTPALALDRVRMEIGRMAEQVLPMVRKGTEAAIRGDARELTELARLDNRVDALHGPIVEYLRSLARRDLTSAEAELVHHYLAIANYYENIGDTLKLNLGHLGEKRIQSEVRISEETAALFDKLVDELIGLLEAATRAVTREDRQAAQQVVDAKNRINGLAGDIERHITRRMASDAPQRRLTWQIESELLENLKRVYYFTKRIGKMVLESGGSENPQAKTASTAG